MISPTSVVSPTASNSPPSVSTIINNSNIENGLIKFSNNKDKPLIKYNYILDKEQCILSFYKVDGNKDTDSAEEFIPLRQIVNFGPSDEYQTSQKRHTISIKVEDGTIYYLVSKNVHDRNHWMEILKELSSIEERQQQKEQVNNNKNNDIIISQPEEDISVIGSPKLNNNKNNSKDIDDEIDELESQILSNGSNSMSSSTLLIKEVKVSDLDDRVLVDEITSSNHSSLMSSPINTTRSDHSTHQQHSSTTPNVTKSIYIIKDTKSYLPDLKTVLENIFTDVKVIDDSMPLTTNKEATTSQQSSDIGILLYPVYATGVRLNAQDDSAQLDSLQSQFGDRYCIVYCCFTYGNQSNFKGLYSVLDKYPAVSLAFGNNGLCETSINRNSIDSLKSILEGEKNRFLEKQQYNDNNDNSSDPPGYHRIKVNFTRSPIVSSTSASTMMPPLPTTVKPITSTSTTTTTTTTSVLPQTDADGFYVIREAKQLQLIVDRAQSGELTSFAGALVGPFRLEWKPLSKVWHVSPEGSTVIGPSTPTKSDYIRKIRQEIESAINSNNNHQLSLLREREKLIENSPCYSFELPGNIIIAFRCEKWELLAAPIPLTIHNISPFNKDYQNIINASSPKLSPVTNSQQHQQQNQQHINRQHQQSSQFNQSQNSRIQHSPSHSSSSINSKISENSNISNSSLFSSVLGRVVTDPNHYVSLPSLNIEQADHFIQNLKKAVSEIDSYFGHNTTLSEKMSMGDDTGNRKIAYLVRGKLATAIANILSHGFKTENQILFVKRNNYIWEFIKTNKNIYQSQHSSIAMKALAQSIISINGQESSNNSPEYAAQWKDPNVKFRAFICLGLNCQMLDQWLNILGHSGPAIDQYYESHAFIRSTDLWKQFCQCFIPLGNLPFKLSIDYECKLKLSQMYASQNSRSSSSSSSSINSHLKTPPIYYSSTTDKSIEQLKHSFNSLSTSIIGSIQSFPDTTSNLKKKFSDNLNYLTTSVIGNSSNNIPIIDINNSEVITTPATNQNQNEKDDQQNIDNLNDSKQTENITEKQQQTDQQQTDQQQQQQINNNNDILQRIQKIPQDIEKFFDGY